MCVLRVSGERFDPDAFLALSTFVPTKVFHRGDSSALRSRGPSKASGFVVPVSDRSWADLQGQIDDGVAFLRTNKAELLRLASDTTVEDVRLDFPMSLRLDGENVMAQFDYLPPALIAEAGPLKIGIELSLYPPTWDGGGDAG
jgi:hypothetical protein